MATVLGEDDGNAAASFDAELSFLDGFVDDIAAVDDLLYADEGKNDFTLISSGIQLEELGLFEGNEKQPDDAILLTNDRQLSVHHQPDQQLMLAKKSIKPKRYTKSNPNRARDERRQELIYLRNKVQDMEQQLNRLKETPRDCARSRTGLLKQYPSDSQLSYNSQYDVLVQKSSNNSSKPGSVSSIWEEIARRQYDQRIDVERENIRLKLVLEAQLKVAKNLQSILNKRTMSRALETFGIGNHSKRVHDSSPSHFDRAIYMKLLAGVEKCYANIDTIFEANGLAQMEFAHNGAHVKEGGANGMYLEIFANKILPFEMHTTGEAVWQHFAYNMDQLSCSFYCRKDSKSPESTDDTVFESFRLEMRNINRTCADFGVKQVLRRYVEEDRIVVVWASLVDPVEFANEPAPGYRFHEEGYIIIRKPKNLSSDFTMLQTCFVITPDFSEFNRSQVTRTGELTNFLLNFIAMNISASHQMIENVLLEQALKVQTLA